MLKTPRLPNPQQPNKHRRFRYSSEEVGKLIQGVLKSTEKDLESIGLSLNDKNRRAIAELVLTDLGRQFREGQRVHVDNSGPISDSCASAFKTVRNITLLADKRTAIRFTGALLRHGWPLSQVSELASVMGDEFDRTFTSDDEREKFKEDPYNRKKFLKLLVDLRRISKAKRIPRESIIGSMDMYFKVMNAAASFPERASDSVKKLPHNKFIASYVRAVNNNVGKEPVQFWLDAFERGFTMNEVDSLLSFSNKRGVAADARLLVEQGRLTPDDLKKFRGLVGKYSSSGVRFKFADYFDLVEKHGKLATRFAPYATRPKNFETALSHAEQWGVSPKVYLQHFWAARRSQPGENLLLDSFISRTSYLHPKAAAETIAEGVNPSSSEYPFLEALSKRVEGMPASDLLAAIRAYRRFTGDVDALSRLIDAEERGVPRDFVSRLLDKTGGKPLPVEKIVFHHQTEQLAGKPLDHSILKSFFPEENNPVRAAGAHNLFEYFKKRGLPHADKIVPAISSSVDDATLAELGVNPAHLAALKDDFFLSLVDRLPPDASESLLALVDELRARPTDTKKAVQQPQKPFQAPKTAAVQPPLEINLRDLAPHEIEPAAKTILDLMVRPSRSHPMIRSTARVLTALRSEFVNRRGGSNAIKEFNDALDWLKKQRIVVPGGHKNANLALGVPSEATPTGKPVLDHVYGLLYAAHKKPD